MKPAVFIFTKAPFMGRAKTRLAADIGRVHAHRIYRSMCVRIIREVQDPRWDTILYVTPDRQLTSRFGGVWPDHLTRISQKSGDLSDRLSRMFALKGPVIAIGTDAPQIRKEDIAQAVKALKSHDAVFGPADDGGFWLIALNGPAKEGLFSQVRWSDPQTLADMKSRITGRICLLRTLADIDTGASLKDYNAGLKFH